MTQTHTTPAPSLAWSQALQAKLMAALDAAWAILERSHDPAEIRRVRDRAKAIGEIAAMARKVALITPAPKAAAKPAGLSLEPVAAALAPIAASTPQAEIARRALDRLKGGRRGRP